MTENFPDEGMGWKRNKIKYWRRVITTSGEKKLTVYGDSIVEVYREMNERLKTVDLKKHSFGIEDIDKAKPCKDCPFMYCHNCLHKNLDKNVGNDISKKKMRSDNMSGRSGVHWNKREKKWRASLGYKGKTYYAGDYESFDDAVEAREFLERNVKGLAKRFS